MVRSFAVQTRFRTLLLWVGLLSANLFRFCPGAEVLFSETFAAGDRERPRGWEFTTSDNMFWQVREGRLWTGNGDDLISPDGYSFAVIEAPGADNWVDYRINANFQMKQSNGQVLLVARWSDRRNYYRAALEVFEGRHMMRLAKVVRGRETELAAEALDLKELGLEGLTQGEKAFEMFLTVSAAQVQAGLADKVLASARDTSLAAGTAGVGQRYNEVYFDDILVNADTKAADAVRTVYHVEVGSQLALSRAADLQKQLLDKGLGPAFLKGTGSQVSVMQGNYLAEAQAREALDRIKTQGFSPAGIASEERGAKADNQGAQGAFSVQLMQTKDNAQAQGLVNALRKQAYFPFVDNTNGTQRVLIGRFATREEARRMQLRMVSEGFSLATVIDLDEIGAAPPEKAVAAPGGPSVPKEVQKSVEWESLSPQQQKKVIEAVMMQRASRMQLQSVEEIARLKKTVESLSKQQVDILNRITSAEQAEEEKRRAVSRLTMAINRAQDAQDWAGMKEMIERLEEIDPNSPLAAMKRNRLKHLVNNTWEGQDIYRQNQEKRAQELRGKAQGRMSMQRYEEAMEYWHAILSMDGANEALQQEASQKIEEINRILDARRDEEKRAMEKERKTLYVIVGAVAAFFLLILVVGYFIGRARYNRMATQLREEAIAPLQALQEKAGALGGPQAGEIGYGDRDQGLIEQAEAPDAEFMIPEVSEIEETPEPEVETVVASEEPEIAEVPEPQGEEEEAPSAFAMPDFQEPEVAPQEGPEAQQPPQAQPAPAAAQDSGEEFMFSFDESDTDTGAGGVLPETPETPEEDEDVVLSFDTPAEEKPEDDEPVTAEVTEGSQTQEDDGIVFSFDDAVLDEGGEEPPAAESSAETIVGEAPSGGEDSIYESIPLEDLNLDLGGEESQGDQTAPLAAVSDDDSPLSDDLDLDLDLPDLDETPAEEESPLSVPGLAAGAGAAAATAGAIASGASAGAGDVVFAQDTDSQNPGERPAEWQGEDTAYASLSIAEDPEGSGGNCIAFKKTSGDGPTSFRRQFPAAKGRFQIEYDLRCDEKNKHLLGFYVEQDNDFRRSVHTVVQCTDPLRPAHLRVFTRPTGYQLGEWRHVRYVVDLDQGLVDGYVDEELVAEGVRMGTKAEYLNTLSIRDDSETAGVLYLRNLVVAQV